VGVRFDVEIEGKNRGKRDEKVPLLGIIFFVFEE